MNKTLSKIMLRDTHFFVCMRASMPKIIIQSGPNQGLEYTIGAQAILGRQSENEIPLADTRASRQNSKIFLEHNIYYIEDMQSRNGTLHNGQKITKQQLISGDCIQIGETVMLFLSDEEASAESKSANGSKVSAPVFPEVSAPVSPEVSAPVSPEVSAPVSPEVSAPVSPESKVADESAVPASSESKLGDIEASPQLLEQKPLALKPEEHFDIPALAEIVLDRPIARLAVDAGSKKPELKPMQQETGLSPIQQQPDLVPAQQKLASASQQKLDAGPIQQTSNSRPIQTNLALIQTEPSLAKQPANADGLLYKKRRILVSAKQKRSSFWDQASPLQRIKLSLGMLVVLVCLAFASRWITLWLLR